MKTGKSGIYINTYGKKGTMYYYKARVMIYDKEGNFVAQTALKQCKYANRLWTKQEKSFVTQNNSNRFEGKFKSTRARQPISSAALCVIPEREICGLLFFACFFGQIPVYYR